eukprot:20052_1
MAYYEMLESNHDLERYEITVVSECGEHAANGIYFLCSAPFAENTECATRYIRKPNSKSSTFFVFNEEQTILYREYSIKSYALRVEKYDQDLDYSEEEDASSEDEVDVLVDIKELTKQELAFFIEVYGDDGSLTQPRFKHLRQYINEYNKYQVVLYKLNQDITPNKWECVEGNAPAPKVTFVDNKQIDRKEKDYVPNVVNGSTIGLKYEPMYAQFFGKLQALLSQILQGTNYNIFESKLIFNILKEYLFCYHQNCGMMRCLTRGRWNNPYSRQWILFFCNICTKKWAHYIQPSFDARFEVFPSELISNVKFKYGVEVNGYKVKNVGDSIQRDDLGKFNNYSNKNAEPFPMLFED